MERLTTNKDVSEMGMYELAHNGCYYNDEEAIYRDFEMQTSARDFARNLMTTLCGEDLSVDDDEFDEEILENLQYDPFTNITGLIALFYRNLWAMADLRECLKEYEDLEEQGLLLRLPCKVGDTVYFVGNKFVNDYEVRRFIIDETGIVCIQVAKLIDGKDYWNGFSINDFCKTVFLKKDEAEQKLKEMKGCKE